MLASIGGYAACGDSSAPDAAADAGATNGSSGASSGSSGSSGASSGNGSSGFGSSSGDASSDARQEPEGGAAIVGKVVTEFSAVGGVTVVVQGKSVQTAANGSFTLTGVIVPYDLSVVIPPSLAYATAGSAQVVQFVDLTTPNPIVDVRARVTRPTANLTGTLTGGSASPSVQYLVFASGPSGQGNANGGTSSNPKVFEFPSTWPTGQSQQNLDLIALEYVPRAILGESNPLPQQYTSQGVAANVTVENGAQVTRVIALESITTTRLTGTITFPESYTRSRSRVLGLRGPESGELQFSEKNSYGDFDFLVPFSNLFPTARIMFFAYSDDGSEYSIVERIVRINETFTTDPVTALMPLAPSLLAPQQSAGGVTTNTALSWTPVSADCLYQISVSSSADGSTQFEIHTTASSATIPDLSSAGAGLTPATAYTWQVFCNQQEVSPASADAVATLSGAAKIGSSGSRTRSFLSQ